MIGQDKMRTSLTLEKDLKKKLEEEARHQSRSLNNLIAYILNDYMKNKRGDYVKKNE